MKYFKSDPGGANLSLFLFSPLFLRLSVHFESGFFKVIMFVYVSDIVNNQALKNNPFDKEDGFASMSRCSPFFGSLKCLGFFRHK